MKTRQIHLLTVLLLWASCAIAVAQVEVKGQLIDDLGEPLIGANIIEKGTTNGTMTDIDGFFTLTVKSKNPVVTFKYVGFQPQDLKINQKKGELKLGVITMQPDSKTLSDVVVTGTVAVARKTPVAVSTISAINIEERIGTQEFPEVLKSTPGVHANKQGGGYGDSEIYMRGFDNTNVATMINGVPMNDMENGNVYWSNWAGLSDVTRDMQTQRGLGASKVSAPSVGGTINIITKGVEAKKGGSFAYTIGNDNMNKLLFTVSTGMNEHGWALTLLGGKTWGNGNAQGLDYVGYNYFLNISKKFNSHHSLSLTAFGAPQEHYQRGSNAALTLANWKMVERQYGVTDYRFNSTYGFDQNGQRKSSDYNVYHKPQISLNHQWQINDKSNLSTSAYVSIGRGYGYAGEANGDFADANGKTYSYSSWNGSRYGELYNDFRKADGTFDYGMINDINANSEYGSLLVMSKSLNYHNWYGLLSTYSTKLGEYIDFYGGVDFRYYKGTHTNEIQDLYGGAYYMDEARGSVKAANNYKANDPAWRYEKLGVGDVIYRDYDSHVVQEGLFFQTEYDRDNLTAFVSGSVSNTAYWRYDRLYYDEQHAKSEVKDYWGGTIKGGANWNIDDHNNIFANIGYISRAPKFAYGAFMTSTTSNVTNPNAKNEKIFSVEAGYGFRNEWLTFNLNAYWTKWMDKTMTKSTTLGPDQIDAYLNMTGVNAIHQGIELEAKAHPFEWLDVNAMFSLGDWQWASNATGYFYDEQGLPLTKDGAQAATVMGDDHAKASINLDGVRVGGSAQTTANLGVNFKLDKNLKAGLEWTYYGRNYSYYSFSGSNLSVNGTLDVASPWQVPSASIFDAMASYRFKIGGVNATLRGNVNNLLNYHYIVKAWNPSSLTSAATADNIYCFLHTGRTYSISLKINF